MVKDIEDLEGDKMNGIYTLPVVYSLKTAKIIISFITFMLLFSILYWVFTSTLTLTFEIRFFYLIFIVSPIFLIFSKIWTANQKKEYHFISKVLKNGHDFRINRHAVYYQKRNLSMITKCILGSQSPRRKQLMETIGFPFEIMISDAEEDFPETMPVRDVALYLATKKAQVLLPYIPDDVLLLTADSTVICLDKIYNKPADRQEAIEMLSVLSGQEHEVITGVWIGNKLWTHAFSDTTFVTFKVLSQEEIEFYVDHYQPYDKAGAYGIQDWIGTTSVISIKGSYTNVMGLPTQPVYQILKQYFH